MVDGINTNRITGLASGMDTEKMVKDLMEAERMPLNKMEQEKTWMTWQRDAYRDVNKMFFDLDSKILDMKLQKTYNSKSTSSTQSGAVTATATAGSSNGVYNIEVEQLATAAVNYSQSTISGDTKIDPNKPLTEQDFKNGNIEESGKFTFYTYDKDGNQQTHDIDFKVDDSLNDVLDKISTESGGAVNAFYDSEADKVILERTETGDFNQKEGSENYFGAEIVIDDQSGSNFLTDILNIHHTKIDNGSPTDKKFETGGQNAKFTYNNGYEVNTNKNSYTLDGVTFNFTDTTNGSPAKITVNNDVDAAVEKIVKFVDKYNELIEKVNDGLQEKRYRDYKPLTDDQREAMSDKEIELWEEKAKSGLLSRDTMLQSGVFNLRQNWYAQVDNTSSFSHLSEIGIETSSNYLDGGKLIVSEDKLRKALQDDPESVHKLFSNDVEGDGRGLINRLEDSIEQTMGKIEERAGKGAQTLEQYTMGKRLKDLNSRIDSFEDRLVKIEDRYWRQFTQMEKAIQRMNQQSMYLSQQFGGM
ncbi:flagellar hook-associated protein 2 [Virgibacillus sp. FSP13]